MRVRAWLGGLFASVGILVIGWQAGLGTLVTAAEDAGTSAAGTTGTTGGTATTDSTTDTSSGTSTTDTSTTDTTTTDTTTTDTTTTASSGLSDGTYTGGAYSTRWGDVQVQVTISGGSITNVTALQLTDADRKSVQISNRAAPILAEEVVSAQSADVSMVSGATYTSEAYLKSVQSALDQANA